MKDFVLMDASDDVLARSVALSWDSIVFLKKYVKGMKPSEFKHIYLDSKVFKDFSGFETVVALGTIFDKLPKGVTHVVFNEFSKEKDYIHHRRSGLNHVFLNSFEGEVLFVFSPLQGFVGKDVIIGRMMQNARLCSNWSLCSFASSIEGLRDVGDVKAFERILKKKSL